MPNKTRKPQQPLVDALAAARTMLDENSWIDEITAPDEDGEPNDYAQRVVPVNDVRDALDSIEAAAEREREAVRDTMDAMDCAAMAVRPFVGVDLAKGKPTYTCVKIAPGNAAAMRAALERLDEHLHEDDYDGHLFFNLFDYDPKEEIRAALAAPARNADRFKTAEDAAQAYRRETEPDRQNADCYWPCIFDWLFATAEGGNHA